MSTMQMKLFADRSKLSEEIEQTKSESVKSDWWEKANKLYLTLSPVQKEHVDEKWKKHLGPRHPIFYVVYCDGAKRHFSKR